MKVGIIDSGVEVAFLRESQLSLAGAARFTLDLEAQVLETRAYERDELDAWRRGDVTLDIEDEHSHGTCVLSILHSRARPGPDVDFYVARIFDKEVRAYSLCLLEALRWLLDEKGVDVLNLSLGTPQRGLEAPLREVIDRAVERGAVVACAAGAMATLPAQFESVISVGDSAVLRNLEPGVKVDHVVRETSVRLFAGGSWRSLPMTTSFACAVAVGDALREGCPPAWKRPRP